MKASNPHTEIKIGSQWKQFFQKIHAASRVNCTTLDPGVSPILSYGMKERPWLSHYKSYGRRVLPCFMTGNTEAIFSKKRKRKKKKPGFVIAEKSVEAWKTEANEKKIN